MSVLLAAFLPAALLSATVLLSVPDPAGDANGDGSYQLPARPAVSAAMLDLRLFRAENVGGKLQLSTALGAVGNPWQAPAGFSGLNLDIFVKTGPGGADDLGNLGLRTVQPPGWQEHYRVNGFVAQHFSADTAGKVRLDSGAPRVSLRGTDIVIDTDIQAGAYSYWVMTSLYTPFSPDGVARPGGDTSLSALRSAREGTPAPIDVLLSGDQKSVYTSGALSSVGQVRDVRALTLLGLAVTGLVVASILGVLAWRRGA
ncbi:hypothetical protein GCM10022631_25050 [Deinococcus rubellus]|uniref:Regulator n=1 Tax=Deinococcus rubellus TaxID=1889240 RepID=A0ABY5YFH6_9DEIO|nr:glucodextranase DOMON-like domain-containing protein [Deinococcus rubellus]UWX63595.1 regulator [Deinococcus rubellus]